MGPLIECPGIICGEWPADLAHGRIVADRLAGSKEGCEMWDVRCENEPTWSVGFVAPRPQVCTERITRYLTGCLPFTGWKLSSETTGLPGAGGAVQPPTISWLTILRKREDFRRVFFGFDYERVAEMGEADVERLLQDASIIRHRGKIEATINNAHRAIEVAEERGSLGDLIWEYEPPERVPEELVATTAESTAMPPNDSLIQTCHCSSCFPKYPQQ